MGVGRGWCGLGLENGEVHQGDLEWPSAASKVAGTFFGRLVEEGVRTNRLGDGARRGRELFVDVFDGQARSLSYGRADGSESRFFWLVPMISNEASRS